MDLINKIKNSNINNIVCFFILYISLIIGFLYNENLNYGSYGDWINSNLEPTKDFSDNFLHTFLNFDQYGHRHSPVYVIFLSLFLDLGFDIDHVRLIHLHLSISLVVIFYMCLKLKFKNINNNYLIALSLILFLSPTFRSLSIWPDSRLPGLTFFVLTIYFFLKLKKTSHLKYTWYTCVALIISSYISPNFSVFFPYFFFFFLKKFKFVKLIPLLFFNFLAALPMLYYIFILDVNFLIAGKTPGLNGESLSLSFNFSNKLMIISSIIFFHLLPILILSNFYKSFISFIIDKSIILFSFTLCLIYYFNYQTSYTGGGVFFVISNFLFGNNYLFFLSAFFFIGFFVYIASLNWNNFFLLSLIVISNIQNTIYHKYYEPMVIIVFFTLLSQVDSESFLKKRYLIYFYLLSFIFILMRIIKLYLI
jgi:hypothetical protein